MSRFRTLQNRPRATAATLEGHSSGDFSSAIQFKDEGSNLGTPGTVTSVNFVGSLVAATRSVNEITVTANLTIPEYLATLTQNGGSAPVATELINTTGATVTYGRTSTGLFTATFSSAILTASKTVILMGSLRGSGTGQTNLVTYSRTSTTIIGILCQYQAAGATNSSPFDGDGSTSGLVETAFSVMIYP